jgi:hypothetical protein
MAMRPEPSPSGPSSTPTHTWASSSSGARAATLFSHLRRSPLTKRVDVRTLPRETHGTKDNASDPLVPASLKQYMIENFKVWQGDQLVTRMEELRSMLYTNRASTAIVFCVCACVSFLTVYEWRSYPAGRAVRALRLRLRQDRRDHGRLLHEVAELLLGPDQQAQYRVRRAPHEYSFLAL